MTEKTPIDVIVSEIGSMAHEMKKYRPFVAQYVEMDELVKKANSMRTKSFSDAKKYKHLRETQEFEWYDVTKEQEKILGGILINHFRLKNIHGYYMSVLSAMGLGPKPMGLDEGEEDV